MFKLLAGLVTGNPWGSVILLAVLIGAGFSGGAWMESLIKNAEISKLKLDAQGLQTQLSESKALAEENARTKETALREQQDALVKDYQQRLDQKEKEHEQHIAKDRRFAAEHPASNFVLPADTGLDWVRPPAAADTPKPDLSAPGGTSTGADGKAAECRLSDLLTDRDNYKGALGKCAEQVKALQRKVLDDLRVINGN